MGARIFQKASSHDKRSTRRAKRGDRWAQVDDHRHSNHFENSLHHGNNVGGHGGHGGVSGHSANSNYVHDGRHKHSGDLVECMALQLCTATGGDENDWSNTAGFGNNTAFGSGFW